MGLLLRFPNVTCQTGGEEHSGWLPPNASKPSPTPIIIYQADVSLEFDGSGYLVICAAHLPEHQCAPYTFDEWHASKEVAMQSINEQFKLDISDHIGEVEE
ncbi:MAG: hypothetical protein P8M30_18560 [Planctomycetaceae bacterium]|jgi:hypothetical protein|nr:hypothetical protein [Planctomycetaceae bacterium]